MTAPSEEWPTHTEPESRWTIPTPTCPHPERWHSTDPDSTEVEVTALVWGLVRALQPDLVIETGSAWGQTAQAIGNALALNGQGHLLTFETDPPRIASTADRCKHLPVQVVHTDSIEGLEGMIRSGEHRGTVGFAWLDSSFEDRLAELRLLRSLLSPGAVVAVHDAGEPGRAKHEEFSDALATVAFTNGLTRLSLPTPRGVTLLQQP